MLRQEGGLAPPARKSAPRLHAADQLARVGNARCLAAAQLSWQVTQQLQQVALERGHKSRCGNGSSRCAQLAIGVMLQPGLCNLRHFMPLVLGR